MDKERIEVNIGNGKKLVAFIDSNDEGEKAISIGIEGQKYYVQDLAKVEYDRAEDFIRVNVWGDCQDDDPTVEEVIQIEDEV